MLLIKYVGKMTDRPKSFTILEDVYKPNYSSMGGYAVAQLVQALRYKSEKVAGLISDGVIVIFHPLTEMSTRNISWRVKAADV